MKSFTGWIQGVGGYLSERLGMEDEDDEEAQRGSVFAYEYNQEDVEEDEEDDDSAYARGYRMRMALTEQTHDTEWVENLVPVGVYEDTETIRFVAPFLDEIVNSPMGAPLSRICVYTPPPDVDCVRVLFGGEAYLVNAELDAYFRPRLNHAINAYGDWATATAATHSGQGWGNDSHALVANYLRTHSKLYAPCRLTRCSDQEDSYAPDRWKLYTRHSGKLFQTLMHAVMASRYVSVDEQDGERLFGVQFVPYPVVVFLCGSNQTFQEQKLRMPSPRKRLAHPRDGIYQSVDLGPPPVVVVPPTVSVPTSEVERDWVVLPSWLIGFYEYDTERATSATLSGSTAIIGNDHNDLEKSLSLLELLDRQVMVLAECLEHAEPAERTRAAKSLASAVDSFHRTVHAIFPGEEKEEEEEEAVGVSFV